MISSSQLLMQIQVHVAEREDFLNRRRFLYQGTHPVVILGASLAIAGAAALSRTTFASLDRALGLLAMHGGY